MVGAELRVGRHSDLDHASSRTGAGAHCADRKMGPGTVLWADFGRIVSPSYGADRGRVGFAIHLRPGRPRVSARPPGPDSHWITHGDGLIRRHRTDGSFFEPFAHRELRTGVSLVFSARSSLGVTVHQCPYASCPPILGSMDRRCNLTARNLSSPRISVGPASDGPCARCDLEPFPCHTKLLAMLLASYGYSGHPVVEPTHAGAGDVTSRAVSSGWTQPSEEKPDNKHHYKKCHRDNQQLLQVGEDPTVLLVPVNLSPFGLT